MDEPNLDFPGSSVAVIDISSANALSTQDIRDCFLEIRNTKHISEKHLLSNGITVGAFCIWYLRNKRPS